MILHKRNLDSSSFSGPNQQHSSVGGRRALLLPAALVLLSAAIFLADLALPPGSAAAMGYGIVVLLASWLPGRRHTVLVAAGCVVLTLAGHVFASGGGSAKVVVANRLIVLVTLVAVGGLVLVRRQDAVGPVASRSQRGEQPAQLHLTRRLLPVCSSCKRIRDGQGGWEEWDVFLQHHFHTLLTHGLCPDCLHQLYATHPRVAARHSPTQPSPPLADRPVTRAGHREGPSPESARQRHGPSPQPPP